jgi:hypothetical protein
MRHTSIDSQSHLLHIFRTRRPTSPGNQIVKPWQLQDRELAQPFMRRLVARPEQVMPLGEL